MLTSISLDLEEVIDRAPSGYKYHVPDGTQRERPDNSNADISENAPPLFATHRSRLRRRKPQDACR